MNEIVDVVRHTHPLSLNGTDASQFTLTHEHVRGDEPHTHTVNAEGTEATSTTWEDA